MLQPKDQNLENNFEELLKVPSVGSKINFGE